MLYKICKHLQLIIDKAVPLQNKEHSRKFGNKKVQYYAKKTRKNAVKSFQKFFSPV